MTLDLIYANVRQIAKQNNIKLSRHWRATVRNTLQRHCRDNPKFKSYACFIHRGYGVWECKKLYSER